MKRYQSLESIIHEYQSQTQSKELLERNAIGNQELNHKVFVDGLDVFVLFMK